jgi:integrase
MAKEVLADALSRSPQGSPWVFSTNGLVPVSGWSKAKRRIDEIIARARRLRDTEAHMIEPWRLHDFRRSFATIAAEELHVEPGVADRCLNHVGSATTSMVARVYGRGEMFGARAKALDLWAEALRARLPSGLSAT